MTTLNTKKSLPTLTASRLYICDLLILGLQNINKLRIFFKDSNANFCLVFHRVKYLIRI